MGGPSFQSPLSLTSRQFPFGTTYHIHGGTSHHRYIAKQTDPTATCIEPRSFLPSDRQYLHPLPQNHCTCLLTTGKTPCSTSAIEDLIFTQTSLAWNLFRKHPTWGSHLFKDKHLFSNNFNPLLSTEFAFEEASKSNKIREPPSKIKTLLSIASSEQPTSLKHPGQTLGLQDPPHLPTKLDFKDWTLERTSLFSSWIKIASPTSAKIASPLDPWEGGTTLRLWSFIANVHQPRGTPLPSRKTRTNFFVFVEVIEHRRNLLAPLLRHCNLKLLPPSSHSE